MSSHGHPELSKTRNYLVRLPMSKLKEAAAESFNLFRLDFKYPQFPSPQTISIFIFPSSPSSSSTILIFRIFRIYLFVFSSSLHFLFLPVLVITLLLSLTHFASRLSLWIIPKKLSVRCAENFL